MSGSLGRPGGEVRWTPRLLTADERALIYRVEVLEAMLRELIAAQAAAAQWPGLGGEAEYAAWTRLDDALARASVLLEDTGD